jgi:hypothetical protein
MEEPHKHTPAAPAKPAAAAKSVKRCRLHVGMHKTGSTSIQANLSRIKNPAPPQGIVRKLTLYVACKCRLVSSWIKTSPRKPPSPRLAGGAKTNEADEIPCGQGAGAVTESTGAGPDLRSGNPTDQP